MLYMLSQLIVGVASVFPPDPFCLFSNWCLATVANANHCRKRSSQKNGTSANPPTKELQPVTGEQLFHEKHMAAYSKKFDVRCAFDFVANAFHHVSCKVPLVNLKLNLFKSRPAISHFHFRVRYDVSTLCIFCFLRLSLQWLVDCLVKKVLDGLLFRR